MVGVTLVTWFAPEHYFGGVPLQSLRYGVLFLLATGLGTFWLALWPLKRVETDGEHLFVSNYFRTARYHLVEDVESISERRFLIVRVATVRLRGAGTFGRQLRFVTSRKQFAEFRRDFTGAVDFS